MSITRGYRRGKELRNGDISLESLKKNLGFKDIEYSKEYSEEEKQKCLNYSYDALIDLSDILRVPAIFMSLKDEDKPLSLYFGTSSKVHNNLILTKEGRIAYTWFRTLDRCLGKEYGYSDGLIRNVSILDDSNELFIKLKKLIKISKLKNGDPKISESNSLKLEDMRLELEELLEQMPIKNDVSIEEVATIEDSREKFLKELTSERLDEMLDTFAQYEVELGDLGVALIDAFNCISDFKENIIKEVEPTIVKTDYFNKVNNIVQEDIDLVLLSMLFENLIYEKQKEMDSYNNYLVKNIAEDSSYYPSTPEKEIMLDSMQEYISVIIDTYIKKFTEGKDLNSYNNEEIEKKEIEKRSSNIDSILVNDKGKFKLTLFKKLAKEKGLFITNGKSDKSLDNETYYIYFSNSNLKYIRVPIYNNPNEKNHCINIYYGLSGDTKKGYWWDNELNYNDLITELLKIENEKSFEKFRLSYFKELCKIAKLNIDMSESKQINGYYKILFKKSYIDYLYIPTHFKNTEIEIIIKTLCEEVYQKQTNNYDYNKLIQVLVKIEKDGWVEIKKQKEDLDIQRQKELAEHEKLKKELDKQRQKELSEHERLKKECQKKKEQEEEKFLDVSNLNNLKDLKNKLNQYSNLKNKKLNYSKNFVTIVEVLQNNIQIIDGITKEFRLYRFPENKGRGNSKSWGYNRHYDILISENAEDRKKIEGLIEGFVDSKLKNKCVTNAQEILMKESVTYMLCKSLGLDVRTYCVNNEFEKLIKSSLDYKKAYLMKCYKIYDTICKYFEL